MNFEIIFVLLALVGMIGALIWDGLRPGMVLLTVVVLFLCVGILTPKEMLEGFSNKGMITVGMLFLVSEGIRQSGALGQLIKKLLPEGKTTVFKAQLRMLPPVAFYLRFSEQHACCRYLCSYHQALGGVGQAAGDEIPDSSFVCDHFRRHLYSDRDIDQPGRTWHDPRCRI